MAEVGQRLLLDSGSWGRTVFRELAVRLKELCPRQKGRELWQAESSVKLKEDEVGVRHEGKKLKQKEGLVGQVHTLLRQKTGPLGQEAEGVAQRPSSLSLDGGLYQESRILCEWDQRQQGGSLGQKEEVENHREETASLREIVLNRWVGLEEEVQDIFGPWIPVLLHLHTYPIPDNSNLLTSWPKPLQARGNDVGRDLTQISLVDQEAPPYGTMNDTVRKCSTVPLLGQRSFSRMTALICGDSQQKLFIRAYSTRNGTGRSNDSLGAPLFRSRTAYYDILGITGSATQAQIKTAYYRQSFRYHPDRNSGNEEAADRFNEISEAYLILGSVTLRKKYDRGILSQEDVRAAGKPSSKMTGPGAAVPKRTQTTSSSRYSPGKPVFDFDEFYRAHYGEQLEREKFMKWKREQLRQRKEDMNEKWQLNKLTEAVVLVFISSAFILLLSLK